MRINWTFSADALACDVDVSWQGQLLARKHLVSNDPILAFDARGETSPGMMIVGQLHFDASRAALLLDQLRYPGGSARRNCWAKQCRPPRCRNRRRAKWCSRGSRRRATCSLYPAPGVAGHFDPDPGGQLHRLLRHLHDRRPAPVLPAGRVASSGRQCAQPDA